MESDWKVAIKVLTKDRRSDDGMLARMQLEAQAGLRLQHPNILRTVAIKQSEDRYGRFYYVVMELIQGVTPLEMHCISGLMAWEQACDIIKQAATGLQYAHDAGLIHRDVKPENLLVRSSGAAKILDFGLAMVDENDEEFSMAMIFGQDRVGTADYVAPEQTMNSYQIDHRADIYSLGCTLYFLLTGKLPFPYKNNAKKLVGHRRKKPIAVREQRPDVPEEVAAIVDSMMAKRPTDRPQTAAHVAQALEPFADRREVEFNFEAVRRARVKHAEKRLAERRSRRQLSSGSCGQAGDAATESAQASVETKIPGETSD